MGITNAIGSCFSLSVTRPLKKMLHLWVEQFTTLWIKYLFSATYRADGASVMQWKRVVL